MPAFGGPHSTAPVGSTGNNTHAGVSIGAQSESVMVQFNVEAVGATPTVTLKLQGSMDGTNWFDLFFIPNDSDTAVASIAKTAVGFSAFYPSQMHTRFMSFIRLVTSANTNVTYSALTFTADHN